MNNFYQDVKVHGAIDANKVTEDFAEVIFNSIKTNMLEGAYPVGSIYISVNEESPASIFGGTWEQIQDKFLLSAGSTYTAGDEGGSATHTLTLNEMPAHQHEVPYSEDGNNQGWQQSGYIYLEGRCDNTKSDGCWFYSNDTGGNLPHNNMPPYLTVYMWKRVE